MKESDLIGKTISRATYMKFVEYDDEPILKLEFTDNTSCFIVADYGGYSGGSEDEYRRYIYLVKNTDSDMPPYIETHYNSKVQLEEIKEKQ